MANGNGNRGRGRPKGSPNKTTAEIKQAFLDAFDGAGGVPSLVRWAKGNPSAFYKVVASLLPKEVKADMAGSVVIRLVEEVVDGHPANPARTPAEDNSSAQSSV